MAAYYWSSFLAAGVVIFWLASSRITGEVVVATGNQNTTALPGASVTIYSVNEDQRQRITGALAKIQQRKREGESPQMRASSRFPRLTNERDSDLAGYNNLSDTKHCFALERFWMRSGRSGKRKTSTDNQGRFAIWALPGRHLLEIVGQESNQRFEFVEHVDLKWRSDLKLTEPSCRYSLTQ